MLWLLRKSDQYQDVELEKTTDQFAPLPRLPELRGLQVTPTGVFSSIWNNWYNAGYRSAFDESPAEVILLQHCTGPVSHCDDDVFGVGDAATENTREMRVM